jgi:hypothetical protein
MTLILRKKRIVLILTTLTLFVSLFPNISIFGFSSIGSQPNDLILGLLLLPFISMKVLPKNLFVLLITSFFSLFFYILQIGDLNALKSCANYISLWVGSLIFFSIFSHMKIERVIKIIKTAIWVWFIVAALQYFISPTFLSFLLPHQSGSLASGRGVTSLATEPTYYGYTLLLLICIVLLLFKEEERKKYIILLIFQLFIFSISSTAIATFIISLLVYAILKLRFKALLITIFALVTISFILYILLFSENAVFSTSVQNIRLLRLISSILDNPAAFMVIDASGNRRFLAIFFSFIGSINSFLVPHGFGNFDSYIYSSGLLDRYSDLIFFLEPYPRIQSSIGAALFELGIIGLVLILAILKPFTEITKSKITLSMVLFIFLMINPIPFTNSLVHICVGLVSFLAYNNSSIKTYVQTV